MKNNLGTGFMFSAAIILIVFCGSARAVDYLVPEQPTSATFELNQTEDYYMVLPGNGTIDISLTTHSCIRSDEGFRARLYNYDGIQLYDTANVGIGFTGTIETRDLPPSIYIVHVSGYDGSDGGADFNGGTFTITTNYTTLYTDDDFGDDKTFSTELITDVRLPGIIETTGDEDWFHFDTVDVGEVWVGVEDATGIVTYELQDQWGTTLATGLAEDATGTQVYFASLPYGVYFIRVTGGNSDSYEVYYRYEKSPFSTETDDVSSSYDLSFPLLAGYEHSHTLGVNDADLFYIHQPVEGPFSANLIFLHTYIAAGESIQLDLQDRNGQLRDRSVNADNIPETINVSWLPAGLYFLRVYGKDGTDGGSNFDGGIYTLKVETSVAGDDVEDTSSKALLLGTREFSGFVSDLSDTDMFCTFLADQGDALESLKVTVDRIFGSGVDLRILDSDGTEVASSVNSGTQEEIVTLTDLPKGFYFCEITTPVDATTAYRINMLTKLGATSTLTDDIGDSAALALPLPFGCNLAGSLITNDKDYFTFEVPHSSHVRITLTNMTTIVANETIDLELRDSNDTLIYSSYNALSLGELIEVQRLTPGTYYARVFGRDGSDGGSNFDGGCFAILISLDMAYGDVSGDGTVSPYDASLVRQHLEGSITLSDMQTTAADVDGVAGLSENDAQQILEFSVGNITSFPVEQ